MSTITVTESKTHPGVLIDTSLDRATWDYYSQHYGQLVGKRIKRIVIESFEGQAMPVLEFDDGRVASACVMQDPEGNGPGHLDIITR